VYGINSVLYNCTLIGNNAVGSGGGVCYGTLYNCTLVSNSASIHGGGVHGILPSPSSTLYNCALIGNSAENQGGGMCASTLYNCTLIGNQASFGGGAYDGALYNCIIYFNHASISGSNWFGAVSFTNCCTASNQPFWAPGNIISDPMFVANGTGYGTNHVAGNYRLSTLVHKFTNVFLIMRPV